MTWLDLGVPANVGAFQYFAPCVEAVDEPS